METWTRVSATELKGDGWSLIVFFKMKEGGFGGRFDVRLEKESGILDDTKVADLRGLVDLAPICIKMEIFSLLE